MTATLIGGGTSHEISIAFALQLAGVLAANGARVTDVASLMALELKVIEREGWTFVVRDEFPPES